MRSDDYHRSSSLLEMLGVSSSVLEMLGMRSDDYHLGDHEHHAHDSRQDLSFSSVSYTHFKCPVRPGLTRERCVVMIIFIAAGDAGGFGVSRYHRHNHCCWRCVVMIVTVAARDAGMRSDEYHHPC